MHNNIKLHFIFKLKMFIILLNTKFTRVHILKLVQVIKFQNNVNQTFNAWLSFYKLISCFNYFYNTVNLPFKWPYRSVPYRDHNYFVLNNPFWLTVRYCTISYATVRSFKGKIHCNYFYMTITILEYAIIYNNFYDLQKLDNII